MGMKCINLFFNDTATTEIYTLSLHDALPISAQAGPRASPRAGGAHRERRQLLCAIGGHGWRGQGCRGRVRRRSEEHTSELQSRQYLVCRLLLEKKKISLLTSTASLLIDT